MSEKKRQVGGWVAIEGCFAIEGCLPQDVHKWPKKLPAEAGTCVHFFRTKSSLYCKPALDGGSQSLDQDTGGGMVGEARSSLYSILFYFALNFS